MEVLSAQYVPQCCLGQHPRAVVTVLHVGNRDCGIGNSEEYDCVNRHSHAVLGQNLNKEESLKYLKYKCECSSPLGAGPSSWMSACPPPPRARCRAAQSVAPGQESRPSWGGPGGRWPLARTPSQPGIRSSVLSKIKHLDISLNLEADKKGEGECEDDHNPGYALEEDSRQTKTTVTDLPSTSSSSDTSKQALPLE